MDFKDPQNKKQLQKNIITLMKEYSDKLITMSESNDYKNRLFFIIGSKIIKIC